MFIGGWHAAGNSRALTGLAEVRERLGDLDEAHLLYELGNEVDDPHALIGYGRFLARSSSRIESADSIVRYRRQVDAGDVRAVAVVGAFRLATRGREAEAEALLRQGTDLLDNRSRSLLAVLLLDRGATEQATLLVGRLLATGTEHGTPRRIRPGFPGILVIMSSGLRREITFSNADVVLAGMLAVPESSAPVGGAVMLGGSGPADRHNDGYFTPIREHLVGAGIAVLSYDKRGVGGSSGDWRDATIDELASDAIAALGFLRAHGGVRGTNTAGLFGHSEGGWVALRAAAREQPPWVVTNSCPGMTPSAQERYALAGALRRSGAVGDEVGKALDLFDQIVEAGRGGSDLAAAERLINSPGVPRAFVEYWADLDERLWEFLKRKYDHEPLSDASRLRCPHLALFGGADELVPVAESIHAFTEVACRPGRLPAATLTTTTFPAADHRIGVPSGGLLAPGYLAALSRWITAQCEQDAGPGTSVHLR